MEEQFIESVDKAIGQIVLDFQCDPNRYWSERDIHWNLFYYLKQQEIFQQNYVSELIRAEFPTRAKYGEGKARGHYDLAVLEPDSLATPAVLEMAASATWDEFLPLVRLLVAVEVKTWWVRWSDIQQRVSWDIKKLTDPQNSVKYTYLLNFVWLNFSQRHMKDYYYKLREHLVEQTKHWPKLKILCVPSDVEIQPPSDNWISTPR